MTLSAANLCGQVASSENQAAGFSWKDQDGIGQNQGLFFISQLRVNRTVPETPTRIDWRNLMPRTWAPALISAAVVFGVALLIRLVTTGDERGALPLPAGLILGLGLTASGALLLVAVSIQIAWLANAAGQLLAVRSKGAELKAFSCGPFQWVRCVGGPHLTAWSMYDPSMLVFAYYGASIPEYKVLAKRQAAWGAAGNTAATVTVGAGWAFFTTGAQPAVEITEVMIGLIFLSSQAMTAWSAHKACMPDDSQEARELEERAALDLEGWTERNRGAFRAVDSLLYQPQSALEGFSKLKPGDSTPQGDNIHLLVRAALQPELRGEVLELIRKDLKASPDDESALSAAILSAHWADKSEAGPFSLPDYTPTRLTVPSQVFALPPSIVSNWIEIGELSVACEEAANLGRIQRKVIVLYAPQLHVITACGLYAAHPECGEAYWKALKWPAQPPWRNEMAPAAD